MSTIVTFTGRSIKEMVSTMNPFLKDILKYLKRYCRGRSLTVFLIADELLVIQDKCKASQSSVFFISDFLKDTI